MDYAYGQMKLFEETNRQGVFEIYKRCGIIFRRHTIDAKIRIDSFESIKKIHIKNDSWKWVLEQERDFTRNKTNLNRTMCSTIREGQRQPGHIRC